MIQQLIQSYMKQLQGKNAKGFKEVQDMMNMGKNPEPFVKQIVTNMKPEEKQVFFTNLQKIGCPNNVLSRLQNMK